MDKKATRIRRARRSRAKMFELGVDRLTIHKSPRHIYAQVIKGKNEGVVAAASTVQKDIRAQVKATGGVEAAALVGKLIAERAKEAGISKVAFDRSGFKYHGRIKALADAAREAGLEF